MQQIFDGDSLCSLVGLLNHPLLVLERTSIELLSGKYRNSPSTDHQMEQKSL